MAFDLDSFYNVGPDAGPTRQWRYDTTDSFGAVATAGYFNGCRTQLRVGDTIDVNYFSAGAIITQKSYLVTERSTTATIEELSSGESSGIINPKDFGAQGDGVTDDTTAIQAAITAAEALPRGTVNMAAGAFLVTSSLRISQAGVTLQGAGKGATRILFVPAGTDTCLEIWRDTPGTNQINHVTVRELTFYSTETTLSKTAIHYQNAGRLLLENIIVLGPTLDGSYWQGADSTGIYGQGREQCMYRDISVYATLPFRFGPNPSNVGGSYDIDQFAAHDIFAASVTTAPATLPHALFLFDDGMRISQASWDGHQSWVGGKYGAYFDNASTGQGVGSGLRFDNVQSEQDQGSGTGATIYISQSAGSDKLLSLDMTNFTPDIARHGIYADDVGTVTIRGINWYSTTAGIKLFELAGSCYSFYYENLYTSATPPTGAIVLPADMVRSWSTGTPLGSTRLYPTSAQYVLQDAAIGVRRPNIQIGDAGVYCYYATLAPAAVMNVPINSNQRGVRLGFLDITGSSDIAGNNLMCSGRIAFAANASGTSGLTIVAQGGNMTLEVGGATAGRLSVTSGAAIAADVQVKNNHATETLKILIVAFYNRSTEQ